MDSGSSAANLVGVDGFLEFVEHSLLYMATHDTGWDLGVEDARRDGSGVVGWRGSVL